MDPEDDAPPIGLRITVSVGVAGLPESAESLAALVEVADRALYEATRRGRNLVIVADELQRATHARE